MATPYGSPASAITIGTVGGRTVAFLPRTSVEDAGAPYRSPFRANVWALASLGVSALITTAAAGGLRETFSPGMFLVPDQYLDLTGATDETFYGRDRVLRVSSAEPFDPTLRSIAVEVLTAQGARVRDFGTVVGVRAPRFSTRAESRFWAACGGDVVSMGVAPEAGLALELGMGVVNLALVSAFDAAVATDADDVVTSELVERRLAQGTPLIRRAIMEMAHRIPIAFTPPSRVPADAVAEVLGRPAQARA